MWLVDRFNLPPNIRRWLDSLEGSPLTEQHALMLNRFVLVDNIDYDKFVSNLQAAKAQTPSAGEQAPACTPSFQQYLLSQHHLRAQWLPHWFVLAYPDVVIWVETNLDSLRDLWEQLQQSTEWNRPAQLRSLVDRFKQHVEQLECGAR